VPIPVELLAPPSLNKRCAFVSLGLDESDPELLPEEDHDPPCVGGTRTSPSRIPSTVLYSTDGVGNSISKVDGERHVKGGANAPARLSDPKPQVAATGQQIGYRELKVPALVVGSSD
jgi:hypothetical protein